MLLTHSSDNAHGHLTVYGEIQWALSDALAYNDPGPVVLGSLRLSSYQRYLLDLYGPAKSDWFMRANYGLLVSLLALAVTILAIR